jgi:hypothetical protein
MYLILTKGNGGFNRSADDAYSYMALDPTFALVDGPCFLALDFVYVFGIMIMSNTLLT